MNALDIGFLVLFVLFSSASITVVFRELQKRRRIRSTLSSDRTFEFDVKNFSPPLISQLIDGKGAYTRHIIAGLLHLVYKDILVLSKNESSETYIFSFKGTLSEAPCAKDEKFLVEWLLFEIGKDGVFHTDDLLLYTEDPDNQERFIHKLSEWEQTMKKELEDREFLHSFPTYKAILLCLSGTMLLVGSGLVVASPVLSILYLIVGVTLFIVMVSSSSLTRVGWREYFKWKAFVHEINDDSEPDLTKAEWLTAKFAYAVAFGMKGVFLKKIPIRDASQFAIRQDQFPLYFATGSGATVMSSEGVKMIDELEASLEQVISPVIDSTEDEDLEY